MRYAFALFFGSIHLIWFGRILSGIGDANSSLIFPYVSRTVMNEEREAVNNRMIFIFCIL